MKRSLLVLAALTLAPWAKLSWAANGLSVTRPSETKTSSTQPTSQPSVFQPSIGKSEAAQTPPQDWTSLAGTVQAVNRSAKTIQIKDVIGTLVQVLVDRHVTIQKDGEWIRLSKVQIGDIVTVAKRGMSSQEKERSMAF